MEIVSAGFVDLKFEGKYEMDGKISLVSLKGKGDITAFVSKFN